MGDNRQAVEQYFGQVADAWKRNDGGAIAETFVADGTLINPFGERADGREAIASMYTDYFGGMLQGTTTTVKVESVRAVDAENLFVDAEQTILGPGGDVVLVVHLATLLRNQGGRCASVEARPYAFAAPPA
jgi:uncharacterized protein (TIGR02246 family)